MKYNWKKETIKIAQSMVDTNDIREYFQKECQDNCKVSNYNYHCPRCKLTKYINNRRELGHPLGFY